MTFCCPHTQPKRGMGPSKIVQGKWQYTATRTWADECKSMHFGVQGEVSVPVIMDAIIEQVSRAAAGQFLLAAAQAADQEAAAAAALEAAFPSNSISTVDARAANQAAEVKPQSTKKIVYAGDSVGSAAAGIVTGTSWLTDAAHVAQCLCYSALFLPTTTCSHGHKLPVSLLQEPVGLLLHACTHTYSITACINSEVRAF